MNVLITGGSGGIGGACAMKFASEGYSVGLAYHNNGEKAKKIKREIETDGGECEIFCCDVSSRDEVESLFHAFSARFGDIDVLVNCAGIASQKLFLDITLWEWNRMMDVNLTGVFNTCQCALYEMAYRKKGSIVNVSSMWGITGASCEAHYSAAKGAVIALTKALSKEYGASGVRVNCVAPGVIDTKMNAHLDEESMKELCDTASLGRIGTPEETAEAVYFLASEKASYITGQVLTVDGGFIN